MLIKLLIALLGLVALLFIALLWLVAAQLHWSMWLPAVATAFIVLSAACIVLFRKLRATGAAAGLERGLAAQAKEQVKLVRPDFQAEVQNMQGEFDKAVAALKQAKLGPGGSSALYFLPWYAIIGPPGAGKSTALRNSGLNFPYTSGTGGPSVKGLGGTRNCDWWLSNEAVVLDTAGRWATQDEDRDEWLSFLGLLKRYRPKKPLNGLIAAISVGDVVNAREDEVEALAQRMRARLDEVQTQLRVSIPVYVFFTKTDLVEGFLETFGDLRRSERGQVWGFTLPLSEPVNDVSAVFNERFNELADVLERRSLLRMSDERSVERRGAIYAFPQQFTALRRNLQRFVEVMFEKNVYQASPTLRGCYFTSGTQEGRPFNLLMNRLVEAMGIRRKVDASESAIDQKSYFLNDLFMKVIFQDRDIASASDSELRRQRRQRLVVTSALSLVSLAVGLIPGYAWSRNTLLLRRIESAVDEWEAPEQKQLAQAQKLERLDPLRECVDDLRTYDRDGVPLSMRMGMYQADDLVSPLRRYYANLLRRELVQAQVSSDLAHMTDFGLRYASLPNAKPKEVEQNEFYALLKFHLILTGDKRRTEPALQGPTLDWVKDQLRARWSSTGASPAQLDSARVNAELFAAFLGEMPTLVFSRDNEVVQRVRATLNRVPAPDRVLNVLIASAERGGYGLTLRQLVGGTAAFEESSATVRSAFTRRGYENVVRDALVPELLDQAGEPWVLGLADDAEAEKEQRAQQFERLRTRYFSSYIEEWQNFLRTVRTHEAHSDSDSLELTRELTRGVPAVQALLIQQVHHNLQLEPKLAAKLADQVGGAVDQLEKKIKDIIGPTVKDRPKGKEPRTLAASPPQATVSEADVLQAFRDYWMFAVPPDGTGDGPTPVVPFAVYKEQLELIRDALQASLENPAEADQSSARLKQAKNRVRTLIEQQPGFKSYFEALLWPPVAGATKSHNVAIASGKSQDWCNEIVAEYARTLAGHYPFNRNGQDIALADFSNFYRPKTGQLWSFVDTKLTSTVQLDGDRYKFVGAVGEGNSDYTQDLIEFLGSSRDIMLSFFPTGAGEPSSEFEVRVRPSPGVAVTQFYLGGKSIEHSNGPEQWKTLVWPGPDASQGAALVIRGANGMQERLQDDGPWGLMRLLERGTLLVGAGRTFTIAWQLQTHPVTLQIDFRPKRSESPFLGVPGRTDHPAFMQPLRARGVSAPKHIAMQGATCKI